MNKVIITGAAGFVGSALVKECLEQGIEVYALDLVADPSFRLPLGHKNLIYLQKDLRQFQELESMLKHQNIDTFFHFAWQGSAGVLREDYSCQIDNATLTVELLKFAKEIGCQKFVCAGTIMEFETHEVIYAQETKPQMAYLYGVGKTLAHSLCKPIANKIGIDLVWAYITNAYGVGELSPRLINTTIRKCINHQELNFTAGTQNYDFIYIDDVARAFYLIGQKGQANKAYMIGSGTARPLKEFLTLLVKTCDETATPNFGNIPFTGVNLALETFSIKELEEDCGFKPQVSFVAGVKKTWEWLKQKEQ
ncbi:MAG: NAD-dependent epimerase/dehydratase family protein [Bacilli bacterium]